MSPKVSILIALVVLACAGSVYMAARLGVHGHHEHGGTHGGHGRHAEGAHANRGWDAEIVDSGTSDLHDWMHEQLRLRPEQEASLHPIEDTFARERNRLEDEIDAHGQALAAAIREGRRDGPETLDALAQLQEAQAELQRLTLQHVFQMEQHLDSEQAERLLTWTHDSLLR